jgi:hypothetical protein
MKVTDALELSLQELRMQMLGVQVLFGFQFQGTFQDAFTTLPTLARWIDAVGFAALILAIGLIVAIPSRHRIVEKGEATAQLYRLSLSFAGVALVPLALGFGCAIFVAVARAFTLSLAGIFASGAVLLAVGTWYGGGAILHRGYANMKNEPMPRASTPIHAKIEQVLTEARVILPGVQALLGFQLVVMMAHAFDGLPTAVRIVHLVALVALTLSMILLIAPAAIHRIGFQGRDDPRFHHLASLLIAFALAPLSIAICCDFFTALTRLFAASDIAVGGAATALVTLIGLWYVWPLTVKRLKRAAD